MLGSNISHFLLLMFSFSFAPPPSSPQTSFLEIIPKIISPFSHNFLYYFMTVFEVIAKIIL